MQSNKFLEEEINKLTGFVNSGDLKNSMLHFNLIREHIVNNDIHDQRIVTSIMNLYEKIKVMPKTKPDDQNKTSVSEINSSPSPKNDSNLQSPSVMKVSIDSTKSTPQANNPQVSTSSVDNTISNNQNKYQSTSNEPKKEAESFAVENKSVDTEHENNVISQEEFAALEEDEGADDSDDDSSQVKKLVEDIEQLNDFKSVSKVLHKVKKQIEDLTIKTDKEEGKWERQNTLNDSINNGIMMVKEDVGGFRTLVMQRERSADKMQQDFDQMKDLVKDIDPQKITKHFNKVELEIESNKAGIEKHELVTKTLSKEVAEYKQIMGHIKNYDNLFNVLKTLKDNINYMEKVKADANRFLSKMEVMFGEVNKRLTLIDTLQNKISVFEEINKDTLKSVDLFETKLRETVKQDQLSSLTSSFDNFKEKIIGFNHKVNDFGLELIKQQKDMHKIQNAVDVLNDTFMDTESKQLKLSLSGKSKLGSNMQSEIVAFEEDKAKKLISEFETQIELNQSSQAQETFKELKNVLTKLIAIDSLKFNSLREKTQKLVEKYKAKTDNQLEQIKSVKNK